MPFVKEQVPISWETLLKLEQYNFTRPYHKAVIADLLHLANNVKCPRLKLRKF